ncbi:site-specific integrase [Phenylobacterium sp.]|uniref:tyrosine-type recombinase/integrase n=1 Tax=Phenylobacterium sp. TaxID=1871053 RepID=UPI0025D2115E|nr:site-specific integrase [Phenylobacterium sp.]MBX3483159.1 site-specific integrase [Phenylobacterium sp.]MCW5759552.1 site-specific integrase [Phenylobacterium sp.]
MSNNDAREGAQRAAFYGQACGLYSRDGRRKYLNLGERRRLLAAGAAHGPSKALFAETMAWTGARVSEVLALTPAAFQIEQGVVAIVTLKRRGFVVREIPLPPELMRRLDAHFGLSMRQRDAELATQRLWPWHRVTAWRFLKTLAQDAAVTGAPACPRGLRHGFGVGALQAGVPLNLVQRWLGHARMSTTAIYGDACGREERVIASRFWGM